VAEIVVVVVSVIVPVAALEVVLVEAGVDNVAGVVMAMVVPNAA